MVVFVLLVGYRDSRIGLLGLGGLMAMGLGVAIFFKPQLGTYVLAATVFTNMSDVFTDMGLPGVNKPLVALTFGSIVIGRIMRRQSFQLKRTEWLLMAYGATWLASAFIARDRDLSINHFIDFIKDFLIVLSIVYSLQSQEHWKRAVWFIIIATTVLAAMGTYQVITGDFDEIFWGFATVTPDVDQMRLSGPVGDPNFYSQILNAVMVLALYRFISEKKFLLKLIAGICTFLLLFVVINSYSRGSFMAMIMVFAITVIERGINIKKLIMIALTIFFVIPLLMPFLPKGFSERMETLSVFTDDEASVHQDGSFQGRTSEMLSGLLMFLDSPFLGIGVGNYEGTYHDYAKRLGLERRTEERQAHSLYVEIIAETGALGLITFLGVIIALFIGLNAVRRQTKKFDPESDWPTWIISLQIAIISYLTTSIFLHGDYIRYLLFLISLGAAAIHLHNKLQESPPTLTLPKVPGSA